MAFAEVAAKIIIGDKAVFKRSVFDTSKEHDIINRFRERFHNVDIFRSVFDYDISNLQAAKPCGPFCMDFDTEQPEHMDDVKVSVISAMIAINDLLDIKFEQFRIFFSGHKGFHLVLPKEIFGLTFSDPSPVLLFRQLAQLIILRFKKLWRNKISPVDMKIYDRRRIFRVENSLNSKSGLYKIPLTLSEFKRLSVHDIKELAVEPRYQVHKKPVFDNSARKAILICMEESEYVQKKQKQKHRVSKRDINLPCTLELLKGVSEGKRNNAAVALANSLLQTGMEQEEAYNMLLLWNDNNEPPLSEDELLQTFISANDMFLNDKFYGCSSMEALGVCDNRCSIRKILR